MVIGNAAGVSVAAMQGRVHLYEGYSAKEVSFPMRVFDCMNIRAVILTNAAGGINLEYKQGALVVLTDHINLQGENPLAGPNDERFGPRFPDLTSVYARRLQDIVIEEAGAMGLEVRRGIYAALSGPSYETPAEIHMLRGLGADVVGMSTVPEAIVARHMDMQVVGISCITNLAAGVSDKPIDHSQVMAIGELVRGDFTSLLSRVVGRFV
jgi:purine-nucleoside phosphorylase